jgi:hypothetical protein
MTEAWYELVKANAKLTQGDIIFNCPILTWKPEIPQLQATETETEVLKGAVDAIQADVVVMSQACDLENGKVRNVILCPHLSLSAYRKCWEETMKAGGQNPTEKGWKRVCDDIRDGYMWNLAMLNSGFIKNEAIGEMPIEHRVVDFHDVYTIPRDFLESVLQQRLHPRLRLLPPYREHLSQAFARFFMRVGLPVGVSKAW